jgi:hypothetical protein
MGSLNHGDSPKSSTKIILHANILSAKVPDPSISATSSRNTRQLRVKQAPAGEAVAADSVAMVGELAESVEDDKVGGRRGHALINAGAAPVS